MATFHQSFLSRADEVAYILQETRRLEQLITQLHEERAALLRRLNVIQSPTTTIPAETLSLIFEHVCPPPDFSNFHNFPRDDDDNDDDDVSIQLAETQPFQLNLSAVSSHWRQVSRSSPRIWDTLSLQIKPRSARRSAALLRLFLLNSKTVPFTLSIRFSEIMGPNTPFLVHRTVDDLVVENLPRIKELHLVRPPRQWHEVTPFLTQLEECSLNLERHETYNLDKKVILPRRAPLRRFSLQAALWRFDADFQLPWSSITSLTLSYIPPDLSVQAFLQCPNLVEFRCSSYSNILPPLKTVDVTSPVTFNYLEVFEWETKATPWSRALICYLRLPVLRRMRWNAFDDPNDIHIQAFLNRLPPTLTELELFPPSHLGYIRDDMNIDQLGLDYCTAQDLLAVFSKLKPRLEGHQIIRPLPRLRKLTIGEGDTDQIDSSYSIAVWEMLDNRLDHFNNSFHLHMPFVRLDWLPEVHSRVVGLLQAGFDVQIHDGSEVS